MKTRQKLILLIILSTAALTSTAQSDSITFTARASATKLRINEPFRVTYVLSGPGASTDIHDQHMPPTGGSNPSFIKAGGTRTSMTFTNGKTSASMEYDFYMAFHTAGRGTLQPATVTMHGHTITSNAIHIEVSPERITPGDSLIPLGKFESDLADAADPFGASPFDAFFADKQRLLGVSAQYDSAMYHVRAGQELSIYYHIHLADSTRIDPGRMEKLHIPLLELPDGLRQAERSTEASSDRHLTSYHELNRTFHFFLRATKNGVYVIPPFFYTVDNKRYPSPAVTIVAGR